MNSPAASSLIRPCLCKRHSIAWKSVYQRFHRASAPLQRLPKAEHLNTDGYTAQRFQRLKAADALRYPRIRPASPATTCFNFQERYAKLPPGQHTDLCTIRGRVHQYRRSGKRLAFIDVYQDGHKVQVLCNLSKLDTSGTNTGTEFDQFFSLISRGDIISINGHPKCEVRGENSEGKRQLSLEAVELPTILAPAITPLPTDVQDSETRIRNRHVDMVIHPLVSQTLRLRSHIIQCIRQFFLDRSFLEVQTPIIADKAGGAVARPFTTSAIEFPGKALALRIAPEIWLKRLIIGDMDRVFEIGPAFRNEGLDATHNPEFTSCEFYQAFVDLEGLMSMTEQMITCLVDLVDSWSHTYSALPTIDKSSFEAPFQRIDFVRAVEEGLGCRLPDLSAADATEKLTSIFIQRSLDLPASPTLPQLLDKLSSIYIEPHCTSATYIVHHPACLAPLSKSFYDTSTQQTLSARAELFIRHREIANMYEEENSPFEQRAKFEQQIALRKRGDEGDTAVDESYIRALEYGLPPTGGWGCGVDRLVMMLTNARRISDVLPFGNLRNVVGLGSGKGPSV